VPNVNGNGKVLALAGNVFRDRGNCGGSQL
jgi:hypothetical protein